MNSVIIDNKEGVQDKDHSYFIKKKKKTWSKKLSEHADFLMISREIGLYSNLVFIRNEIWG